MKKKFVLLLLSLFVAIATTYAQQETNKQALEQISIEQNKAWQIAEKRVQQYAKDNNIELRTELEDGTVIAFVDVVDGQPVFYKTDNSGAAITTKANTLWTNPNFGGGITGAGFDKVAIWDGGKVRTTHQEFNNTGSSRISLGDNASNSDHATHVAGTIIAGGVQASAKGMAFEASLKSYDWDNVESEMATAATQGYVISNHSWGHISGWYSNGYGWQFYGNSGESEDYKFGCYTSDARTWDNICYNAPYFLIVKSAGNDRGEGPSYAGTGGQPGLDGGTEGYDCIATMGVSKNILTVGAVNKVLNYTGPSSVVMSSFSGWGPADDGRIKPDIVAAGVNLYSSVATSNSSYSTYSGTSMSSPNTTGSLVLLHQYYQQLYDATMRSSTIKAVAIHTAEECGPHEGPDYMYGWGLLNVEKGAQVIKDKAEKNTIDELTLTNNQTFERTINVVAGEPLRVTICWIDPQGTAYSSLNNRTPVLVNDLDLKITNASGSTVYYPYKLNYSNPSAAATKNSTNNVDNVEQVYIAAPTTGTYKIVVTHKGTLQGGSQAFSLIATYAQSSSSASTDATLSNLTVNPGTLTPSFNANTTNYTVNVANNVSSITITGTANHSGATVSGNGNKTLAVGSNPFAIVVTAEDGTTTKTYNVTVNRAYLTHQITATVVGGNGLIAPEGIIEIIDNQNQLFTMIPNAGYVVDQILVDGTNVGNSESYLFENVTANHTISVSFKKTTGLDENQTLQLTIYPNPTTGEVTIESNNAIEHIQLYDLNGCLLQEQYVNQTKVLLDLSNYSAETYILNVDGKILKVSKR
jgi:hypothetical protein